MLISAGHARFFPTDKVLAPVLDREVASSPLLDTERSKTEAASAR